MKNAVLMCVIILALGFSQNLYVNNNEQVRLAPKLLNYQGYLTDTLGIPITNPSISMTFAIFDAVSSGNQKWSETQPSVSVDKGIFHVLLGSVTAIHDSVFNSTDRWLELTVGGQTLSPRTRIVSSAYAYTATYSDTALYARNAAADNDWSFRVSDGADTTLQTSGRWGIARYGNMMYGNADSTHVNLGVACTTGLSGQNYKYSTVSGGYGNAATGPYSFVGGGSENTAKGHYGGVLSGWDNRAGDEAADTAAVVVGGLCNNASGDYSVVGGGRGNWVRAPYSTISGGSSNYMYDDACNSSTISGGYSNRVDGNHLTIAGGAINNAEGDASTIGGGSLNSASGICVTISGGSDNTASGEYTTISGGYNNSVNPNYATICGGSDNAAVNCAVVGGGQKNRAFGSHSGILAGYDNYAGDSSYRYDGDYAVVVGGDHNAATGSYSFVGGGRENTACGHSSAVGCGCNNTAGGDAATIGGGSWNCVDGRESVIAGGYADTIFSTADYSYLFGINSNLTQDSTFMVDMPHVWLGTEANGYEFPRARGSNGQVMVTNGSGQLSWDYVSGITDNDWVISGDDMYSGVSGKVGIGTTSPQAKFHVAGGNAIVGSTSSTYTELMNNNLAFHRDDAPSYINQMGQGSLIFTTSGGSEKPRMTIDSTGNVGIGTAAPRYPLDVNGIICGGVQNRASGNNSFVGGGVGDTATSTYAIIVGGLQNKATNVGAIVCGGYYNNASGDYATICGGEVNSAAGSIAAIGGGMYNTASGSYSTVPGGNNNSAFGNYSFAAGRRAKANNQGCFVWGDATNADVSASVDNRWVARCSGGVYFYTNSTLTSGVYVAAGGSAWSSVSDRNLKENFHAVDGAEILDRLMQMKITTWNYKSQDPSIRHIGPMAQDFAEFGVGEDDKHISTIDADGVALAAVQELAKQVRELKAENQRLLERIEALENE